jgi:hypothetical protein
MSSFAAHWKSLIPTKTSCLLQQDQVATTDTCGVDFLLARLPRFAIQYCQPSNTLGRSLLLNDIITQSLSYGKPELTQKASMTVSLTRMKCRSCVGCPRNGKTGYGLASRGENGNSRLAPDLPCVLSSHQETFRTFTNSQNELLHIADNIHGSGCGPLNLPVKL